MWLKAVDVFIPVEIIVCSELIEKLLCTEAVQNSTVL